MICSILNVHLLGQLERLSMGQIWIVLCRFIKSADCCNNRGFPNKCFQDEKRCSFPNIKELERHQSELRFVLADFDR